MTLHSKRSMQRSAPLVALFLLCASAHAQAPAANAPAPAPESTTPAPESATPAPESPPVLALPGTEPDAGTSPENAQPAPPPPPAPVSATGTGLLAQPAAEAGGVVPVESLLPVQPPAPGADVAPGDPFGDAGGVGLGGITLRVLLQTRYTGTFAPDSDNPRASYAARDDNRVHDGDGFGLNRFFVRIGADPLPQLGFKAIVDFAELVNDNADSAVKQAYATIRPVPKRFEITAGMFKLPYSTLELDPSARFELADFGEADDLVKDLGFAGRDLGVQVLAAPLSKAKWLRVSAGTFRGHAHDEHASPFGAIGGRVETKPLKGLRIGADVVGMPRTLTYLRPFDRSSKDVLPNPPDPLYPRAQQWRKGVAYSGDVGYQHKRFAIRGEVMYGDRVDTYTSYGAKTFAGAWAVVSYRIPIGSIRLMPALRAGLLDADRQHDVGLRRELSAGLNMLFLEGARLLLDVTRTDVQSQSPLLDQPKPLQDPPYYELDHTRVVLQLQVQI